MDGRPDRQPPTNLPLRTTRRRRSCWAQGRTSSRSRGLNARSTGWRQWTSRPVAAHPSAHSCSGRLGRRNCPQGPREGRSTARPGAGAPKAGSERLGEVPGAPEPTPASRSVTTALPCTLPVLAHPQSLASTRGRSVSWLCTCNRHRPLASPPRNCRPRPGRLRNRSYNQMLWMLDPLKGATYPPS